MAREEPIREEPVFLARNEWCEENGWCGEITLMPSGWRHVCRYHPEVRAHQAHVRSAIISPNLVYETRRKRPALVFYAQGLLDDVPRFRGNYVAVFVRYQAKPAYVCTAYFPSRLPSDPGTLLFAAR